ncbi:MAG: phosphatidate cytidylyltransferase [Bdellovibrionales bacterium]
MADSKSTFITRVISAVLGAAVVFSVCYFGGPRGVILICSLAVVLSVREYSRMIYEHCQMPALSAWFYRLLCIVLFVEMLFPETRPELSHIALRLSLGVVAFLAGTLWLARGKVKNEDLLLALAGGSFGILYCVLFPLFGAGLARLDEGVMWFFFMLVVVFFGDTFAYFSGRWFGRRKLYEAVSPNKTWEGALGGLVGSAFGGTIFGASIFQDVSWYKFALFCIVCGAVAQSGDLLMSLIKRVAHVKDSGSIMPGHGGILDRLDGIFIACPLVYAFALYVRPL